VFKQSPVVLDAVDEWGVWEELPDTDYDSCYDE